MPFQKIIPGSSTSFRNGIKTILFENPFHCVLRHRSNAEFLQLTKNTGVTPIVFTCQFHDQSANLNGLAPSSAFHRLHLTTTSSVFANPTLQSVRHDDRDQVSKHLSESRS